jgi:hypothetical protein
MLIGDEMTDKKFDRKDCGKRKDGVEFSSADLYEMEKMLKKKTKLRTADPKPLEYLVSNSDAWSLHSTPSHMFMAWYLIRNRNTFIFTAQNIRGSISLILNEIFMLKFTRIY